MNVARGRLQRHTNPAATFFFLLAVFAASPLSASAVSLSGDTLQSVADVAKQKASDKRAKRVYTNDDFPKYEPADPKAKNEDQPEESKPQAGAPDAAPAAADAGNDSAEVRQAKKVVETKQIQIDTLTEEKTSLESRLHEGNRSADKAAAISESIRNLDGRITTLTKERDEAKKTIDAANKPKAQDQN